MEYINKMKEESILGFYQQLRTAKNKNWKVSIVFGVKQISGKVVSVSKFAVMIDRGGGVITTIAMDRIKMITMYTQGDDENGVQE